MQPRHLTLGAFGVCGALGGPARSRTWRRRRRPGSPSLSVAAPHGRRPSRPARQLVQRHGHAHRAAGRPARRALEGRGRQDRKGHRRSHRAAGRAERPEPRRPAARRRWLHRRGRQCRRLQQLLDRRGRSRGGGERRIPHVAHRRSARRARAGAHAGSARAPGGAREALPAVRRVRQPREPAAGRALHRFVRLERRAAHAAQLLLQQQLHHRADAGPRAGHDRDGARRPHHPDRQAAPASAGARAALVGRLDWLVGGRHAGRSRPPTSIRSRSSAARPTR